MKKVLICGYGNIGKHIEKELLNLVNNNTIELYIYDKYKSELSTISLQDSYDIAFICVPTEMISNGEADISIVKECVKSLTNTTTIVIKSAIPLGTCESFERDNIVISPEYYGTTQHSHESPNFLVLGGNSQHTHNIAQLFYSIKSGNFKIIYTDWRTAELAKYMENCWLATKVTFCCEFADIAKRLDIEYDNLRQIFISDDRVNPSHTLVYDDKPYYDSHCLNKDIPALIYSCSKNNINTPLISAVHDINQKNKSK